MDDEINLMDYIRIINKRRRLIIFLMIIFSVIAFINTLQVPKMYKAEVTFLSMGSGMGGLGQSLSSLGLGGGALSGDCIKVILKSRTLVKKIAIDDRLKKIIFKKVWDEQNNKWIGKEPSLDETASAIQSGLGDSDEKKIEVEWNAPDIAAEIANAYAKGLIVFLNQKSIPINLQILDEAVPPGGPCNKDTNMNLVIGGVLGLFVGVFIAFGLEYWEGIRGQFKN